MGILTIALVCKGAGRGGAARNVIAGLALLLVNIAHGRIAAICRLIVACRRVYVVAFVAASPVLVVACIAIVDTTTAGIGIFTFAAACCVGLISLGGVGHRTALASDIVVACGTACAVAGIGDVCVLQIAICSLVIAACIAGAGMGSIAIAGICKGTECTGIAIATVFATSIVHIILEICICIVTAFCYFIATNRANAGMLVHSGRFVIPFMRSNCHNVIP